MAGRPWQPQELAYLSRHAHRKTAAAIGAAIGRTRRAVYQAIDARGLANRNADFGPRFEAYLREKNAAGWSDSDVAEGWGCDRDAVSKRRKAMGLPSNARGERFKARIRQRVREQLDKAGLPSIGYLRVAAFRKRAREAGWPEDLPPRAVQMLDALWSNGPMTRRELADAIGLPWRGSRNSLKGNGPGGTYLATIQQRGLVVCFPKACRGAGRGRSTDVYALPLGVEKGRVA